MQSVPSFLKRQEMVCDAEPSFGFGGIACADSAACVVDASVVVGTFSEHGFSCWLVWAVSVASHHEG